METTCNHCSKMSGGGFARTEPTLWLYEKNCNTQEWTILRPKLENIDQWSSFRTTGRCFVVKDQHHAVALHLAEWKYCNNIDRLSIKSSMPLKIETSCSPYVAANQSLQAWTERTSKRPALDTAIDSVIVKNIARDNLESPRPHLVLAARLQNSLSGSANAVQACRLRFPKTYPVCFCKPKSASFDRHQIQATCNRNSQS